MDYGSSNPEARQVIPLNRARSLGPSFRRNSFNSSGSGYQPPQTGHDAETESVSEAGDIGDRALCSNRISDSERFSLSLDRALENGAIAPMPENIFLQSHGFRGCESATVDDTTVSSVPSSGEQNVSSLPTCRPIVHSEDTKQVGFILTSFPRWIN